MKFVSTRDPTGRRYTFEEAACSGYAKDGGLFVPERMPELGTLKYQGDYGEFAFGVLRPFIAQEELDDATLRRILRECYAAFPREVIKLENRILELFRGPTGCFKDLGLPFLVRIIAHFTDKRQERRTLLVATTGDTGPACVDAASRLTSTSLRVICCYPQGQVSSYQKSQMTRSPTTMVIEFQGSGDDMDKPIKNIGTSLAGITGANSYNICRPLAQMVHYLWLATQVPDAAAKIIIALPTGAMGNLAAFVMAKLVLKKSESWKVLCACNANDFTYRALEFGDCTPSKAMVKTNSDAINVQIPYNFERVLYYAGGDSSSMPRIYDGTLLKLPDSTRQRLRDFGIEARRIEDHRTLKAIRDFASADFIPDPHTAVAIAAAQDMAYDDAIVIATAHARKFEAVVKTALSDASLWTAYVGHLEYSDPDDHLLFPRGPHQSLDDAQAVWESGLRTLIANDSWDTILPRDFSLPSESSSSV